MALLIVESPAKAKTIQKYLGQGWRVEASFGHFRDLPTRPENGIGIDDNFRPQYIDTNKKRAKALKDAAKSQDKILIGTDQDREGEAIAAHLVDLLNLGDTPCRVAYTEITPEALQAAVENPRHVDHQLVDAQEARRVLDRLIGYQVSPKLGRNQSAGRVQSPALRLVVERERAIQNFKSTKHFGVRADDKRERFSANWLTDELVSEDFPYITDREWADRIATTTELTVTETRDRTRKRNPPAPFTTSTLQQVASSQRHIAPEDTMAAAQKLYEAGAITYMRTDSTRLADTAIDAIRDLLTENNYEVPDKPPTTQADANAADAHEAIRPTNIRTKDAGDDDNQRVIYKLIRVRTLASQMLPSKFHVTEMWANGNVPLRKDSDSPARFYAVGEDRTFAGWQAIVRDTSETEDDEDETNTQGALPPLDQGDRVDVSCVRVDRKTQSPKRYTEASLVKALEVDGIGRPSTYASIIDNIKKRGYMAVKKRRIHATNDGMRVIDTLNNAGFSFLDYKYTANMENQLDQIAGKEATFHDVVKADNDRLETELPNLTPVDVLDKEGQQHNCPDCGRHLVKRESKYGPFWGCSGYPECKKVLQDDNGVPTTEKKATSQGKTGSGKGKKGSKSSKKRSRKQSA
mgnify:CR=1 FL=1